MEMRAAKSPSGGPKPVRRLVCALVLLFTAAAVIVSMVPGQAGAQAAGERSAGGTERPLAPTVIYSFGGRADGSFNEAAAKGTRRFVDATRIPVTEISPLETDLPSEEQIADVLRQALRKGADPLVAVGFHYARAMETMAKEFPDRRLAIIDSIVDVPNVQSVVFRAEEGSYLVGSLAAMASKTRRIGFVGGLDVPIIRQFMCGYIQGARAVDPQIGIERAFVANTGAGFRDPRAARALAAAQIKAGADVVFHAAGGSGLGVIEAAAAAGVFAIGVDSNQNGVKPGTVLTSMLKRVDVAVFIVLDAVWRGEWGPGVTELGLAQEGVGWAYDEHNALLITRPMGDRLARAEFDIQIGAVLVDRDCPGNGAGSK